MSRSGYSDDCEYIELYRGAVERAILGKRGQAFLKEMLAALDALPNKRLVDSELEKDGEVCAIGSVGKQRGVDMSSIDPSDQQRVAEIFGIAWSMAAEIAFINDDDWAREKEAPEHRFERVRAWVVQNIAKEP